MTEFSQIMEIINSFWKAQALMTANEYDIFTYISLKKHTASSLSKTIFTNKAALERLLNALVGLGFIKKNKEFYSNTPIVEKFLVKGKKDYRGEILKHYHDLWNSWSNLPKAIKSGFSEDFLKDKKFLQDISRKRAFILGLNSVGLQSAKEVANILATKNVERVLDLGGGGGIFSISMVEKNPKINCVIYDLPAILDVTDEIIKEHKKEKNILTYKGDFNKDSLPKEYFDLILLSKVTHIENNEKNIGLFKKCFSALKPGGSIAIHDFMLGKSRTTPAFSTLFDLNMLVRTPRGGVYSFEEYKDWLKKSGFEKFKLHSIPHQTKLLVGKKLI